MMASTIPGVLLITHRELGENLLDNLEDILGAPLQLPSRAMEVRRTSHPEPLIKQARDYIAQLDTGAGVLVLTDACGSTPSNVARTAAAGKICRVLAGVNLPMLLAIYTQPIGTLEDMAQRALFAGRQGVIFADQEWQED